MSSGTGSPRRASSGASVVAYCGSGVSACVDMLAIELAGLARGEAVRRVVVGVERRPCPPGCDRSGTGCASVARR